MGKLQFGDGIVDKVDKLDIILSPKSSRKNFCSKVEFYMMLQKSNLGFSIL
nr:hypothetical protein pmam_500 [Pithovirus mammoth]